MIKRHKTRPIGSVFHNPQYGLIQAVESRSCEDCIFNAGPTSCKADSTVDYCSAHGREDKKSVIFKKHNND